MQNHQGEIEINFIFQVGKNDFLILLWHKKCKISLKFSSLGNYYYMKYLLCISDTVKCPGPQNSLTINLVFKNSPRLCGDSHLCSYEVCVWL